MQFHLPQALEVLDCTPATLRALLSGLSSPWLHGNYGADTFSPYDVVGHLITGEQTDWMVRTRIILQHGTARPFDKYDRYAQFEASKGKSIDDLLNEFARLRTNNLAELRRLNLSEADLNRQGTHAALGNVTLRQLLSTWVAHDLNHLAQIARAMATQYESQVGPWRAYLGIFKHEPTRMDADGSARKRESTHK
ncbi:MAG: DinB family protein [Phycisphaerales bacterium]